jgi:hypothetical protein
LASEATAVSSRSTSKARFAIVEGTTASAEPATSSV